MKLSSYMKQPMKLISSFLQLFEALKCASLSTRDNILLEGTSKKPLEIHFPLKKSMSLGPLYACRQVANGS
jgi:hypothetical protein